METVAAKTNTNARDKRELSLDINVWEQQPGETDMAYSAFKQYLDDEHRKVASHGITAFNWSSEWQWGRRAYEFDKYMQVLDLQDQVRFRRTMFSRQRALAKDALAKVSTWLESTDPTRWTPREAAAMMRVAAQLEQAANGGMEIATTDGEELAKEPSMGEIFKVGPDTAAAIARLLHQTAPRVEVPVDVE